MTNIIWRLGLASLVAASIGLGRAQESDPPRERPAKETRADQKDRPREVERPRAEIGESREAQVRDLQRELDKAMAELKQLRAAGKEKEADNAKRRVQKLETRLPGPDQLGPKERRKTFAPEFPPGPEMHPRVHHATVAIEHLRLAGMPDLAEKIEGVIRERLHAELGPRPEGGPFPPGPPPEMQRRLQERLAQLEGELRELREGLQELHKRFDQGRNPR